MDVALRRKVLYFVVVLFCEWFVIEDMWLLLLHLHVESFCSRFLLPVRKISKIDSLGSHNLMYSSSQITYFPRFPSYGFAVKNAFPHSPQFNRKDSGYVTVLQMRCPLTHEVSNLLSNVYQKVKRYRLWPRNLWFMLYV